MKDKKQILLLSLNTFSQTGGIPQVCKTLTHALSEICTKEKSNFCALALHDGKPVIRYTENCEFRGFKRNKFKFLKEIIVKQFSAGTIILSHVNLLPVVPIIRIFNRKTPIILIAHGVEVWRKLNTWQKHLLNTEVLVWSVSEFTKHTMIEEHSISEGRISILRNCLDPFFSIPLTFNKPTYLKARYRLSQQKVLMSITRMSSHDVQKGYDKVIAVMPELLQDFPNLQYLLCGTQQKEETERLHHLIRLLKLENHVKLIDFIPENELVDHYLLADIFVLPSRKEGFGIAFIEAATCGCEVIAGNADGSRETLLSGALGSTVDPDNLHLLQRTIKQTLNSPKKISAENQQRICLAQFGYPNYEKHIVKLLESLKSNL
ncbi:glycosyltransferase family 4 protein [Pedobacter sp. GR22-6]|uniref:glycosyltransferase family 4 protein n=1 Tax=Pedobacter sp. GR22-6 TaxID=3127957 RepID=UPI00307EBAD0